MPQSNPPKRRKEADVPPLAPPMVPEAPSTLGLDPASLIWGKELTGAGYRLQARTTLPESSQQFAQALQGQIFGQDDAITAVARGLAPALEGVNAPERPLGVFLFFGPTGVGKTELAMQIAAQLKAPIAKPGSNLLVIKCPEFSQDHTISRFLGSPPGYVGYGDAPLITPDFLQKGRTVIVLDEIEKANPALYKLLLHFFDRGTSTARIPLHNGRDQAEEAVLDFTNTVFILTSNLGVSYGVRRRSIGFADQGVEQSGITVSPHAVREHFAGMPEFMGRVEMVPFAPLGVEVHRAIIGKALAAINDRLHRELPHVPVIHITDALAAHILSVINPIDGARGINRAVENIILTSFLGARTTPEMQGATSVLCDISEDGQVVFFH